MTAAIAPLTRRAAWKALEGQFPTIRELHLRKLFADESIRGERLTAEAVGIYGGNTDFMVRIATWRREDLVSAERNGKNGE